ncbi:alpha/beta hydrolase family protein [Microbacterium luticocti]|uniref:alpha/beta hydrolase family protein n=1 Tax=Microbacterium luticocti TaxID=451764 RepID=UPI00041C47EB|nr:alpha/beta fold hydrolase [Microbacterium luticocti]
MTASRRAAPIGASSAFRTGVGVAAGVLAAAITGAVSLWAGLAVHIARKAVTPTPREPDTEIVDLDLAAQTITLTRTPDTELPGRYGLFTTGTSSYLKLGTVLSADAATVTRKLLTEIGPASRLSAEAAFSGWYYDEPEQLHLPFSTELIGSSVGPCPAWLFEGEADATTWVIQVHGRGARRPECLRAVPVFSGLGFPVLIVSYRNDSDAPRSRSGRYGLGATEWRDVDAAVGYALRHGARRVVLMGWSMGGAITLQVALNSPYRDAIAGIILESPVVDWRPVLEYQARLLKVPDPVTGLAMQTLQSPWAAPLTGGETIPLDRLDVVARAAELRHPVLLMHSDDDGFVPSDASHRLAQARPDLVTMQTFQVARHTKLWNYDPERFTGAIRDWLHARSITAH